MRAVAYCRVSTEDQAHGLSLSSQQEACHAEILARGWEALEPVVDRVSGKSLRRPGLAILLDQLRDGEADALVVARLDRLSRSTLDFYDVLGRAEKEGWQLVCLFPNVDMTDPMGRVMAGVASIFAQFEREMIGLRQRESVAARKRAGTYRNNTTKMTPATRRRMVQLDAEGFTGCYITRQLEIEGYPAPGGKRRWHRSTVYRALARLRELQGEGQHHEADDHEHHAHEHVPQP